MMGGMNYRLLFALALTVGFACSPGPSRSGQASSSPTQRLEVQYRNENGSDRTTVITVSLRTTVTPAPARWQGRLSESGCESQEGRSLNLTDGSAAVQIGLPCGWSDRLGPVSPDGRYLVAWQAADGAAGNLHLIDLGAAPADLGPVPNARSADYIATWTNDSRLWYTSDQSPTPPNGRLWSFAPGDHQADSTLIRNGSLIKSVRTGP
jgi:hypothetical protein